jgi:hypothetical protein
VYDNGAWTAVGSEVFTVIDDEQFNGDGSTVAFTLNSTQTTSSVIVSINGVLQIPTTAYAVAGTNPTCVLTFTEAPQSGDVIDVRGITTTTTVASIEYGNSSVTATGATVDIQGNLNPTGNLLYSLGNNTNRWSNLYVGGNTIYLGNLQLKEASANTFAVYTADGVTEANIAVGNIDVTSIQSGTSTISIAAPNGNAVLNVAGTNRIVATTTGAAITGIVSATGNIIGSYLFGNGSQITGLPAGYSNTDVATYLSSGTVSTNILTTGLISATGNITGGNIITGGGSGGNITGANVISSTTLTASGNVTGGNILTAGLISATGNVSGGNLNVTGNIVDTGALSIITGSNGNIALAPNGTGIVTASGAISAVGNVQAGNIRTVGTVSAAGGTFSGTLNTSAIYASGEVSSAGTVTGANFFAAGNVQVNGRFYASNGPSVATLTGSAFAIDGTVSATGAITGAALTGTSLTVSTGNVTAGNIVNANANGVGNIGSSTTYFNTVFAKATSAQYADLAEKYTADAEYAPGTVVSFGGSAEVTQSGTDADRRVAGVVSTNPSYIMNGGLDGANVVTVALTGRVPCRVTGTVRKGDMMVSNGDGTARAEADPKAGAIIGKALENFDGSTGVIEVVIGRF